MSRDFASIISKIKKDVVVAFARYSLSSVEADNKEALMSSVLFSWFSDVEDGEEFYDKYMSFERLDTIIRKSMLFDLVEPVYVEKNRIGAEKATSIYHELSHNADYLKTSEEAGYRIPREFGEEECYLDGVLIPKVEFYHDFCRKLDDLHHMIPRKEGNHR